MTYQPTLNRCYYRPLLGLALLTLALLTTGCGPTLSFTKTIEVEPREIREFTLDAVSAAQTINIEASSPNPFHIHAHLAGDNSEVDVAVATKKESDKILAGEWDVKNASLKVEIPADKEAVVRIQATNKKSSIIYSVSN